MSYELELNQAGLESQPVSYQVGESTVRWAHGLGRWLVSPVLYLLHPLLQLCSIGTDEHLGIHHWTWMKEGRKYITLCALCCVELDSVISTDSPVISNMCGDVSVSKEMGWKVSPEMGRMPCGGEEGRQREKQKCFFRFCHLGNVIYDMSYNTSHSPGFIHHRSKEPILSTCRVGKWSDIHLKPHQYRERES